MPSRKYFGSLVGGIVARARSHARVSLKALGRANLIELSQEPRAGALKSSVHTLRFCICGMLQIKIRSPSRTVSSIGVCRLIGRIIVRERLYILMPLDARRPSSFHRCYLGSTGRYIQTICEHIFLTILLQNQTRIPSQTVSDNGIYLLTNTLSKLLVRSLRGYACAPS